MAGRLDGGNRIRRCLQEARFVLWRFPSIYLCYLFMPPGADGSVAVVRGWGGEVGGGITYGDGGGGGGGGGRGYYGDGGGVL